MNLDYNNVAIRNRSETLSLTDMWRANGSDPSKRPAKWQETDSARQFIDYVAATIRGADSLIQTTEGRGGGTWAHWQVGLAYAKYLSPAFHVWCNEVVRAHMERLVSPPVASTDFAPLIAAITNLATIVASNQEQTERRLATLELVLANRIDAVRADALGDGRIGNMSAKAEINAPIRACAEDLTGDTTHKSKAWRTANGSYQARVRGAVGFYRSWSLLPKNDLANVTNAILDIKRETDAAAKARAGERERITADGQRVIAFPGGKKTGT